MFHSRCFSFTILLFLTGIVFISFVWGQPPSSTSYILPWKTMDGGGNEGGSITSANYKLSSAIAQGTAIGTTWAASASYLAHPGFRKVDLDWRPPYTQLLGDVSTRDTITVDSIFVQWIGQDTTIEEGDGWGIWVYDVQYKEGTGGVWTDWYTATADTENWFTNGGAYMSDTTWYYFRVRAHDLATNVAPWDTTFYIVDVESVYTTLTNYTLIVQTSFSPGSIWVDAAGYDSPYSEIFVGSSTHNIAVRETVIVGDSIRYIFTQWNDGVTDTSRDITAISDTTFTAEYDVQYRFALSNPCGYDTPVPAAGTYWYDAGAEVSGYMTNPIVPVGSDSFAIYEGFTGTGSAPTILSGTTFWFVLNNPSSITWTCEVLPNDTPLCTLFVYSPYGHPMPTDTTVFPYGTTIYATVEESVYAAGVWHHCTGWYGGGSVVPPLGVGNAVSFHITETSYLVWCWDGDCELPLFVENDGMTFDPIDGYDTPTPTVGTHWYPAGTDINAYVTTPADGMQCVGYWGSGSVPTAGTDTNFIFTINEPTSIHWRWFDVDTTIVCLTVYSEYDSPNPPIGTSCYPIGTPLTATVAESTYESGAWHVCTGYWGSGSVPTDTSCTASPPNSVSFNLDVNSQIVWMWDCAMRFPLIVYNEGASGADPDGYDTPVPTVGLQWYDYGTIVNCSVTTPADGMQCISHTITWPDSAVSDTSTSFDVTVELPTTVNWHWAPSGATIVYLTVYSEYGTPDPPRGVSAYVFGDPVSAGVEDSVYEDGAWQINTGWSGSGSVPTSGDSNEVDFTINTDSWIVWQWNGDTLWPFVVVSAHDTPVPGIGTNWYHNGDTISGYITDPAIDGYFCTGFNGWGDLWDGAYTHFEGMVITQPSGVTWLWNDTINTKIVIVRKDPDSDTYGMIYVDGIWVSSAAETLYVPTGNIIDIAVSNPDYFGGDDSRYLFTQWGDAITDTNRTETINTNSEFVAQYTLEHRVVVQKNPTADTLGIIYADAVAYPGSSSVEIWWQDGTALDVAVSPQDSTTGIRYIFDQWDDSSTDTARTINVTSPTVVTAFYNVQYLVVIQKNSAEPYGCIYVGDSAYCGVASYEFWVDGGTSVQFAVTPMDTSFGMDSIYTFTDWTGDGTDTLHPSATINSCDTFVANYNGEIATLCLSLLQHGGAVVYPDSCYWWVNGGDSVDVGGTYEMTNVDMITVQNCGNLYLQAVLWVEEVLDEFGAPSPWSPAYLQGDDHFVLRARFETTAFPPTAYSPSNDYLKTSPTNATLPSDSPSSIFGPGGGKIGPAQEEYLYLQLLMPTSSSVYGLGVIHVKLQVKVRLH